MKFHAALFDMDGLLLDTERIIHDCLHETAEHFDLTGLRPVFLDMIGLRAEKSDAVLRAGLGEQVDFERFREHAYAMATQRLEQPVPVKTDVERLLQYLKTNNIPCAVASSTRTDLVESQLEAAGLRQYFVTLTGGDKVKNPKPDPEIYHTAAASIDVAASNCIAFEDSPHGTRAALASGATTIQVPDLVPVAEDFAGHGQIIGDTVWHGAVVAGLIAPQDH